MLIVNSEENRVKGLQRQKVEGLFQKIRLPGNENNNGNNLKRTAAAKSKFFWKKF